MVGLILLLWVGAALGGTDLEKARDAQDLAALDRLAAQSMTAAQKQPGDAAAQYRFAMAESSVAEVAVELRDKNRGEAAAEAGIKAAEQAVSLKPEDAEYHRLLGTLYGQAAAANILQGMKYGRRATDELNKAIQLAPKDSLNYVSRGIGNYYLPSALGGGVELAMKDFQKAIELDPRSAEAHLWMGLALRKMNRNGEARKEFQKAVEIEPARVWAKQQLEKTPQ